MIDSCFGGILSASETLVLVPSTAYIVAPHWVLRARLS